MDEINLAQETFILLPEKALLLKATNALIIADVHLGKGTHFNKAGMPIPKATLDKEIENLELIISKYQPDSVVFLGDLFHSTINSEWDTFVSFLNNYSTIEFILVKGNHDVIPETYYQHENFKAVGIIEYDDFVLSHEPIEYNKLVICGHIHPAIKVKGKAKQTLTLPCFYKTDKHFILPAFGGLTGLHVLPIKLAQQIFIVSNNTVMGY